MRFLLCWEHRHSLHNDDNDISNGFKSGDCKYDDNDDNDISYTHMVITCSIFIDSITLPQISRLCPELLQSREVLQHDILPYLRTVRALRHHLRFLFRGCWPRHYHLAECSIKQ